MPAQFLELLPSKVSVPQGGSFEVDVNLENYPTSPFTFNLTNIYITFDPNVFVGSDGTLGTP